MEIEIIFYQLWSNEAQRHYEEKHAVNMKIDGKDEYLFAVNIFENNKDFLEGLPNKITEGYRACEWWMRGLLASYVKKCAYKFDTDYEIKYYNDWLDNTLWIIQGKNYTEIEKWCNDYRQFVIKVKNDDTITQTQKIIPILSIDILEKLEKQRVIKLEPLEWLKSKGLLGYFVEVMNDKYNLKHGSKRKIKPFQEMFGVLGLSGAINDYKKTGDLPIGHEIIDNILE